MNETTAFEVDSELVEDVAIEELADTSAGSFCLGTVGSAGCPSSAGSIGTASSH